MQNHPNGWAGFMLDCCLCFTETEKSCLNWKKRETFVSISKNQETDKKGSFGAKVENGIAHFRDFFRTQWRHQRMKLRSAMKEKRHQLVWMKRFDSFAHLTSEQSFSSKVIWKVNIGLTTSTLTLLFTRTAHNVYSFLFILMIIQSLGEITRCALWTLFWLFVQIEKWESWEGWEQGTRTKKLIQSLLQFVLNNSESFFLSSSFINQSRTAGGQRPHQHMTSWSSVA